MDLKCDGKSHKKINNKLDPSKKPVLDETVTVQIKPEMIIHLSIEWLKDENPKIKKI